MKAIVLSPKDNVATAFTELTQGEEVELDAPGKTLKIRLLANIPFGHKFSIMPIENGKPVMKYGEVIGVATRSISPGDHVHVHNVVSTRGS